MHAETAHRFPVRVRVAHTAEDRSKVHAVRARDDGFGRRDASAQADHDTRPNATLLLAESAIDGEALGSLRILCSERGSLIAEDRVVLPAELKRRSLAEASGLAIKDTPHAQTVRLVLWKAFHRYCLAAQVDTMLIAVRESVGQDYEWLGFEDVLPGGLRLEAAGESAPALRLMQLGVFEARERMSLGGHPLHDFFFVERHPEIDLLAPVSGTGSASRSRTARRAPLPDHARIAAELAQVAIV